VQLREGFEALAAEMKQDRISHGQGIEALAAELREDRASLQRQTELLIKSVVNARQPLVHPSSKGDDDLQRVADSIAKQSDAIVALVKSLRPARRRIRPSRVSAFEGT
jgi:hypothetical protein